MCSAPPSSFFADELRCVLQEQSFGIQSFSIATTTRSQGNASVKLLEGHEITLKLTSRGYTIESDKCIIRSKSGDDTTYESIESLLQSVSKIYEVKRHEAWVKELEKLLSRDPT
ncbi:hypothetical protein FPV67DRAFT_765514 [Lyophyllum atratum]|nr:hypothetical protein FPV67DRAFT_765514 [Lyophyllum atratum]